MLVWGIQSENASENAQLLRYIAHNKITYIEHATRFLHTNLHKSN